MWGEIDRDRDNQEALDRQTGIDRPKEQREELARYYQTHRPNETWVEKVERQKREKETGQRGKNTSISRDTSGSVMPFAALLFTLLAIVVVGAQSALNGSIDQYFAGHELVRHFLQSWLALMVRVFLPVSLLIMFICALARRIWPGVKFVIAAGLLSFVGTFFYLIVAGVFG